MNYKDINQNVSIREYDKISVICPKCREPMSCMGVSYDNNGNRTATEWVDDKGHTAYYSSDLKQIESENKAERVAFIIRSPSKLPGNGSPLNDNTNKPNNRGV